MPSNKLLNLRNHSRSEPRLLGSLLLTAVIVLSIAEARANVADLTVTAQISPTTFQPGSYGTVVLTVTNHGPDAAGANSPSLLPNIIYQRGFRIPTSSSRDIPYEMRDPIIGCRWIEDVIGPFSDLTFAIAWSFYFPVIPAGETRTCTFPIEFYPRPFESFDTSWRTSSTPEDPDWSNNRFDYRFIAGPPPPPTPVPAISLFGQLILGLVLAFTATKRASNSFRRNAGTLPS